MERDGHWHASGYAEADALNMERCQLDKATLIACAVKRLREDLGNVPDSGKKPSA